jgi:O-antigen/teichoic acid export membrane protein
MLRALLRDSIIYSIPTFVSRGLALLLVPVYTRILSPADFGVLDMLFVFGGLVNLTVALEVSQGMARFYADEPDAACKRAYASSAFWFTVACYGLFVMLALSGSQLLSVWVTGQDGLEAVFRIAVVYIGLNGVFYLIQNQFRWELRSRRYAEASMLSTFVTAAAAVGFSYGLNWGLTGFLWGMTLGALAGVLYGLCWLRSTYAWQLDGARLGQMLRYSMPLVPAGLAVWLGSYLDRLMINHYLSLNEVGLYGVGYRLSSIVGLVVVGVQGALTPLVLTHYREPGAASQLAVIFRLFLAGALMMFLTLSLFARDIMVLMTTPDFYGSAALVIYLVPGAMLAQMYIFAPGINIAKKAHLYIWLNLAGVLVNATLSWCLIPLWGIVGAAVATLTGSGCVFVLFMYISQRLYAVPHDWKRLMAATAIAVTLAALIPSFATTGGLHWLLNLLVLVAMVCGLFGLGLVRKEEVMIAKRVMRERLLS